MTTPLTSEKKQRFDIGQHSRLANEALKKQPELLAQLEGQKALIAELQESLETKEAVLKAYRESNARLQKDVAQLEKELEKSKASKKGLLGSLFS